jgi:hypothetical protein
MSAILDERRGSFGTLDGVKKRHNILKQFLETQTTEEVAATGREEDAEIATLEALVCE